MLSPSTSSVNVSSRARSYGSISGMRSGSFQKSNSYSNAYIPGTTPPQLFSAGRPGYQPSVLVEQNEGQWLKHSRDANNRRHSSRDVWDCTRKIPNWWRSSIEIRVVSDWLLLGFEFSRAVNNQSEKLQDVWRATSSRERLQRSQCAMKDACLPRLVVDFSKCKLCAEQNDKFLISDYNEWEYTAIPRHRRTLQGATSQFVHLEKISLNFSSSTSSSSLLLFGFSLPLWCFSTLINNYF